MTKIGQKLYNDTNLTTYKMNYNGVVTRIRESPYKWIAALAAVPPLGKGLEYVLRQEGPFENATEVMEVGGYSAVLAGLGYILIREMERARMRDVQRLEELAMKDHLTGIY